jgi:hypothetical protein
MSHQQQQQQNQGEDDQEGDQPLLQQPHSQVVMTPDVQLVFLLFSLILQIIDNYIVEELAPHYNHTPYHTSALSGEHWVQELLAGHPERIRTELGVYRSTFIVLVKAIQAVGLHSSRNVSIEEQLSIFLYTVVTGLPCTHIREHFQRSSDTITKCVINDIFYTSLTSSQVF